MFYDKYAALCREKNLTLSKAAEEIGLNKASVTNWKKNGYTPRAEVLQRIADYFGVSVSFLLGSDEKAPALTKKDERDIAKNLERIMAQLDEGGDLMFDGDPMSDEARESIKAAMKLGLEAAKLKNKERFTPKKYRKEQE